MSEEEIKLRCIELSVSQGYIQADDCLESARKYFAFVMEKRGENVIDASASFSNRSKS